MYKLAVFITCNDKYVPLAIIALKCFLSKNPEYNMYIIGTTFSNQSKEICCNNNIKLIEINLSSDFVQLDKRPYGKQYPIECFYHFYAYKSLSNYDYLVNIEPDIYTNRKLDVDFSKLNAIAGSYTKGQLIKNFSPIMGHYKKIKAQFKNCNIDQKRISGGFRIYNVKKLNEINFYDKVVYYYKTSIRIKAPRCGDDSLMVLYQLLNPSHVQILNELYFVNNNNSFGLSRVKEIYHYHFAGSIQKYWINSARTNSNKYFTDKFIEYIYNNYDLNYIKTHISSIYKDITHTKLNFYHYNEVDNFGDLITPYFLNRFCNNDFNIIKSDNNNKKVISCGSIMRLCNSKTLVYGSGIRDIDQKIDKGIIKIVRGPLTRERLIKINCYCPPVYGDPGLLLPEYYDPKIEKKYELGIIPHFSQYNKVYELYKNEKSVLIINLKNKSVEDVVNKMLSCHKIASSSLHGLIVSDAYKIPNVWIQFDNNIKGDNTKFYDYFKSVNRKDSSFINSFKYKKTPVNILLKKITPVDINFNLKELKNNMFFDENGIKKYTKYLYEII